MDNSKSIGSGPTADYILSFLKQPPLILKNFHHEDLMEFLKCGEREKYSTNDVIINDGKYVDAAYLVASGEVTVWKNNIQLAKMGRGSFLGETFLFSKNYRTAKVIADDEVMLLAFKRSEALNFFRKKPEKLFNIFTRNIIKVQQNKIAEMNDQLYNLKKRLLKNTSW